MIIISRATFDRNCKVDDVTSRRCSGWRHTRSKKRNNGLGPAAVWAEHLGAVGEEATANQRRVTAVADETFAVPVTVVERNELRSAQSYNDAACTSSVTTAAAIDITRGRLGFQVDSDSYPQWDQKVSSSLCKLRSKGRYGAFRLRMNTGCAGKTVRSLDNACHTWAP